MVFSALGSCQKWFNRSSCTWECGLAEEWQEEQKQIELKKLDEVASQRYFRQKLEEAEEAAEEGAESESLEF